MNNTTELSLRMHIAQTVESSTWEFVMLVDGFETKEHAEVWMKAHREILVEETMLKISHIAARSHPND